MRLRGGAREVLITRRPTDSVLAGYWEFPGGKIESGETPQQCVAREYLEEVGLTVRVGEPLAVIEHRYPHAVVRLTSFLCAPVSGRVRHLQVTDHQWVSPGDLAGYQFPPANEPLIEALCERIEIVHDDAIPGGAAT